MKKFVFSEGDSHKFWEIETSDSEVAVNYGRIGTKGQTKTKSYANPNAADKEMEKQIRQKMKKGYTELPAGSDYPDSKPLAKRKSKFAKYLEAIKDYDKNKEMIEELEEELEDQLIVIDWKEYEEDIVEYISDNLKDPIEVELDDRDLKLNYKGKSVDYTLPEDCEARWITVCLCQQLIKDTHEIKALASTTVDDTIVYVLNKREWWNNLEEEIGKKEMNAAFSDPAQLIESEMPEI